MRRHSDWIESVVLRVGLVATVVVIALAPSIGTDTYTREMRQVATQTASRHQIFAVALGNAATQPPSGAEPSGIAPPPVRVPGSWRTADGRTHRGSIEVDSGTLAGARVPIWVDQTGQQVPAPETESSAMIGAVVAAGGVVAFTILVFVALYWLVRWPLDRLRMASWEREWRRTASDWAPGRTPPADDTSV
ncbi:hypothetical protein GCM10009765_52700 [Fodinicola feengrottensis]|uniref:Uncharacterized protein n=2 Tax=Fodinicola feengrottensis TaxID=435914 RepID=A0ABN2I143_9ACTN